MKAICKKITLSVFFLLSLFSFSHTYSQCIGLPAVAALGSNKVPVSLCAPVNANLIYTAQFASPVNDGTLELVYDWGDGSAMEAVPLTVGGKSYRNERTHDFPTQSNCEYIVEMTMRYNGVLCTNTRQIQKISSWRTDNYNGGVIGLASPVTNTTEHLVCEGNDVSVVFHDRSVFNCNSEYIQLPPDAIESPNGEDRWQQIIYNGSTTGNKIPNVSVNGVQVTSATGTDVRANYQDPRGILRMASPVSINDPRRRPSLGINAPGGFGAGFPKAGDVFTIVLRYWNFCNPYDDPNIPGPPADLVNGDNRPIEKTSVIRIVAPPAAPATTAEIVCNGVTPKAFSLSGVPAANTIKWYENISNPDRPGKLIGTSKTLAITAHPEWVSNTVPGVYKVWASQQPTTGTVTCESPKTMVTRTIREKLAIEPLQPVPTELCNGTVLTVAMPAVAATTVGGPVKYTWQGADGITVAPGAAFSADFAINVMSFDNQLAVDRTITIGQTYTTNPVCAASKQYNLKVYQKPVGGQLSQAKDVCSGTAIDTLKLSAYTGTVTRWEMNRNAGAFGVFNGVAGENFVVPGMLEPGKYIFRAVVNNGNCAEVYSTESSMEVFAMPAAVNAGADQFHCSARVSAPLGTGTPSVGKGRWSYVGSVPVGLPAPLFSNVDDANATITIADEYAGAYTLRWTVTNGSCQQADDVVVDFGTTPSDAVAGPDQALCASETVLQGNAPEKGTGQWTVVTRPDCVQCNIVIDNAGSPASRVSLANADSYGTYTLRWSIRSGGSNCYVKTDDVTIRFDRPIDVTVQDTDIICIDSQKLLPVSLSGTVKGSFGNAWWANVNGDGNVSVSTASSGTITASYTPTLADYTTGSSIRVKLVAVPQTTSACPAVEKVMTIQTDRKPVANAGADIPFICSDAVTLHADAPSYGATGMWSTGNASVSFTDTADPFTSVTLPQPPANVSVTWTVTSASGRCVSNPSTIMLSRVAPPNVSDATITTCEIANGTTEVNLKSIENSMTTLSPSERSIAWYRGQAGSDLIAVNPAITLTDVMNNERFEADVTDTKTGCMAQAALTVLVPPAPRAVDGLVGLCDQTAGERKVYGLNLSDQKFRGGHYYRNQCINQMVFVPTGCAGQ